MPETAEQLRPAASAPTPTDATAASDRAPDAAPDAARDQAPDAASDQAPAAAPQDQPTAQTVGDVMLRHPKTLSARATVGEARALFTSPKAHNAIVADGQTFVGVLTRSDLPSLLREDSPIRTLARRDVPTITPERPIEEAVALLDEHGATRLVVLQADGATLAGLLCLDRRRTGFCTD